MSPLEPVAAGGGELLRHSETIIQATVHGGERADVRLPVEEVIGPGPRMLRETIHGPAAASTIGLSSVPRDTRRYTRLLRRM